MVRLKELVQVAETEGLCPSIVWARGIVAYGGWKEKQSGVLYESFRDSLWRTGVLSRARVVYYTLLLIFPLISAQRIGEVQLVSKFLSPVETPWLLVTELTPRRPKPWIFRFEARRLSSLYSRQGRFFRHSLARWVKVLLIALFPS